MRAGTGEIVARLLPTSNCLSLSTFSFQYPLKLISTSSPLSSSKCLTVFILTYGGGLVSSDCISLSIHLEPKSNLCLLTQGSTKIFKRLTPTSKPSTQTLTVQLDPHSTLLLLPDPVQPFADSAYKQTQIFHLPADDSASLIVLDWVTEGRSARGEEWDFEVFESRNEFYTSTGEGRKGRGRIMLRDALILHRQEGEAGIKERMDGFKVFATMVVRGNGFRGLMEGILKRFEVEPRIGRGRKRGRWDGVCWSAARVRGFVVLKAAAEKVEAARGFLREVLEEEGKAEVVDRFGSGCLMCLQ